MRSKNRTPAVYYDDIQDATVQLEKYTAGLSFDQFARDREKQDAVLHRLLILSEAAHRMWPEELALCPEPDWRKIRGLGNVIRHDYDGIDLKTIWDIIHDQLPSLSEAVKCTLKQFPEKPSE